MLKNLTFLCIIVLAVCSTAKGQAKPKKMQKAKASTMLCDTVTGMCEIPGHEGHETKQVVNREKPIKIVYFTDPICSFCWGIEPQLKKLKLEYGHYLEIEYRMGGLLPSLDVYNSGPISKPADVAHHWDEVSKQIEMPIDGDVWLEDPLPSSYPPSIAFKAAQLQDRKKALRFLRRIREMVFLEKKNIAKWNHLAAAALESGLDTIQLKQDYGGKAVELFGQDLELTRNAGVTGFPTFIFTNREGRETTIRGLEPYSAFEASIRWLEPHAKKIPVLRVTPQVLQHLRTLTTKEYAVMYKVSLMEAEKELKALEDENLATRYDSKNGSLWRIKNAKDLEHLD